MLTSWNKLISSILIILFVLSPFQVFSQQESGLQSQAKFYVQNIGPAPTSSGPGIGTGTEGEARPSMTSPAPTSVLPGSTPAPVTPGGPPTPEVTIESKPEMTAEEPEKITELENRAKVHGLDLKLFGYNFFRQPPSSFLPVQMVPVGPDYVVGPGDTVRIVIWGNVQGEYRVTVDRDGQISIPRIGVVHVSGLTFKQLRQVLDREFERQYTNFQMNVTLDNLRTIRVYVVGWAKAPGSYEISSLSTLVNALFAAGGPSGAGSMRNIQVRRGGRVIVHFDMYDFLIHGNKTKDIRLMPEDVIFIPLAGKRAGIGGPLKAPAIYELKGERTLSELIHLAGGLAATAFKSRVQILRVQDRREMVLFEDDLEKVLDDCGTDISLVDGDLVKIFPVSSVVAKVVRIAGAVSTPGEFGLRPGMRIKDLLNYAGGPLYMANLDQAELTRVTVTPQGPETRRINVNLRQALAGNSRENILLKHDDYLFVRTVPEWDLYKFVEVNGQVKFPGRYTITVGETLSSVLRRAGGFTDKAYVKGAFFTRQSVKETQQAHLNKALDRIEAEMLALATEATHTELEPEEAKRQAEFIRQQRALLAKLREIQALGRIVVRLDDPERMRGTPEDIELQDGDTIYIPQIQQSVNVLGAVYTPTAVIYDPYRTVKEYITMVGGPTDIADEDSIYIIKVNGSAVGKNTVKWFGTSWDGTDYTFHIGGLKSLRLDPGDSIVVPEKLERIAWLREIKDIATIFGQLALTAGVVVAAAK
ncbi:MAG: SLBB domain-containing protein [Deltaproteobacteria bacterium]|nr:SLBB domain-containing protein [Deltaproteobacteria bacterium]